MRISEQLQFISFWSNRERHMRRREKFLNSRKKFESNFNLVRRSRYEKSSTCRSALLEKKNLAISFHDGAFVKFRTVRSVPRRINCRGGADVFKRNTFENVGFHRFGIVLISETEVKTFLLPSLRLSRKFSRQDTRVADPAAIGEK